MGAFPGYVGRAPTYVTELVGYLNRRSFRASVSVSRLKLLSDCILFPIANPTRHSVDRGQRVLRGRGSLAALGPPFPPSPDGRRRTGRRPSRAQPSLQPRPPALGHPGGRHPGQSRAGMGGRGHHLRTPPCPLPSHHHRGHGALPARPELRPLLPGHQLFPRGARRGGAEEPGHRQGRPAGRPGLPRAAGLLPHLRPVRGGHRAVVRGLISRALRPEGGSRTAAAIPRKS